MAELHIIGHISSAKNFKQSHLLCKWNFYVGNGWKIVSGQEEGQTQESCDIYTNNPIWDHPIDLHYTTQTLQNSPKLLLQVFYRDNYGRILFLAYGAYNIPLSPGLHILECHSWKPIGTWKDKLYDKFLGRSLQLKSPSVLINTLDRFEIFTQSVGTVIVNLHILAKNFDKFGFVNRTVQIQITYKQLIFNYESKMFFSLVLFLSCITNMAYVTKVEDTLICINDTDCNKSISSTIYTQHSTINDLSPFSMKEDSSNDIEENNSFTTIIPIEITSSRINSNVMEQQDLESTLITPIIYPDDNEVLILEEREICECNLIKFSCDINCCCDIDCNQFHLSAFSHCQNYHVELYDSRYCYNQNFIQRNNTSFILEKLGNNLFCILYDNLPSAYNSDNDLILNNENDLWKMIRERYKWKIIEEDSRGLLKYNLSKYYQHGDIVWKLHNKSIEPIEFLQPGFTGTCSLKKTLRYLENWKSTCIQIDLTNMNRYLFTTTFNNFTVINSLPSINDTFIHKQACQSNICLSIRTHYCLNSFSICDRTKIGSSFCMNSTCINIVKGLKYIIVHNGSAGISNIDVYFDIGDTSHAFYQYFEVQYNWIDANKTKVFARSGNPGYTMGKPIIFGISHTNKSNEIFFNRTDGFLTLPLAGKNGECDQINRHIIAFGEDVKLKCSARLLMKNFTTLSCTELQNLTMHFLMKDSLLNASQHYNAYVSKLGNISKKDTTNWLRIAFNRIPQSVVTAHRIGKRILCSGLFTSMHLDVLYSKMPEPKTLTNYKILGIDITFGKEEDISWPKCAPQNCTDILHIDIISHINFYDVSKPSRYHFVGGPNLDITLPYDFFYPFLNGSKKIDMLNIFVLLIMYVILHANI